MDRFEMYLDRKLKFLNDMIDVLKNSNSAILKIEVQNLDIQREILLDIIHHFRIFVKDAEDG